MRSRTSGDMLRGKQVSGTPIQHYVNECLEHRTIEQLRIPFAAAATRMVACCACAPLAPSASRASEASVGMIARCFI